MTSLVPTIINKDSKFVVVTYWWGRGNLNKNMQQPCPDEMTPNNTIHVDPIKYEDMIQIWTKACIKHKCNHMAIEKPEFAQKGKYQDAINYKPQFILDALDACKPRNVLYIDGDMLIEKYPKLFDIENVDYIATNYNMESRYGDYFHVCYDPYVFETAGGTMFFANSVQARKLAHLWIEGLSKYPKNADDRVFSLVFNMRKMLLECNIIQVPMEYLWLTDVMDASKNVVISHPHCLTAEEKAMEDSNKKAKKNGRHPPKYLYYVFDHLGCKATRIYNFYEYIFFPSKQMVATFNAYLKYTEQENTFTLIKYSKKYGEYNGIAKTNKELMKQIKISLNDDTIYITDDKMMSDAIYIDNKLIIPCILKMMKLGKHVIFIPKGAKHANVKNVLKKHDANPEIELICRNTYMAQIRYKKEFTLAVDKTYPIFIAPHNYVLKHLLFMSKSIADIGQHFSTSYMFVSRIRCLWV